ncbi:proenkephalin-A-like [Cololabis saira]|uniref:proenkephalin-A-like n=1 Tax=Cololabis saira TaxID=129043 RepID=UPI002AD4205F|nr:proenkephalin-A-like [Cololabis saira]
MKTPLLCLLVLLACLLAPGHCDCQGECVACGLLMQQQQLQQAFNTIVCLLECEGHASSSLTWEVCKRAVKLSEGGALLKRAGEELGLTPDALNSAAEEEDEGQDEGQDEAAPGPRRGQYDPAPLASWEDGESDEDRSPRDVEGDGPQDDGPEGLALSKRFGGFQRGRHGYRKLVGSAPRPLQKRYGGFIGVRKSARKWNSQKRVNQLLRQYLGMRSSRSGRFNAQLWRQNKL